MPHASSSPAISRPILVSVLLLFLVTVLGVSISTASDIALEQARPTSHALTVDERTYYEFVAPRLDRLVVEIDDVVIMVEGKSRDIIALTISGNRIEELTKEILKFGESNGVPSRFADVHETIVGGTETVTYTFDQARAALRQFDFSQMTALVSRFGDAAETLHDAQDQMLAVVGIEPALRAIKQ